MALDKFRFTVLKRDPKGLIPGIKYLNRTVMKPYLFLFSALWILIEFSDSLIYYCIHCQITL